jgi:hypothetical protein
VVIPHDPAAKINPAAQKAAVINYRKSNIGVPRTIAESQALVSSTLDHILAKYSKDALESWQNNGMVQVEVSLTDDQMEHIVIFKDFNTGKELGRTSFMSSLTTRGANKDTYSMNLTTFLEATRAQQ